MSRFSIQWEIHSLQKAPSYIFAFKLQGALSSVVPVLSLSLYVDSSYRHCRSHFVQEPRDLSTRHHNSFHYAYIMNINHEPFGLGGRNSRIAHLSLSLYPIKGTTHKLISSLNSLCIHMLEQPFTFMFSVVTYVEKISNGDSGHVGDW